MQLAMSHVEGPVSRARQTVAMEKNVLHLSSGEVLFREYLPLAVATGGYVYFPDYLLKPSESTAINNFTAGRTQVRVSTDSFDFTVGQVLSQAGLRLTALPREEKINDAQAARIIEENTSSTRRQR